MKHHPAASLFPMLEGDAFEELVQDIREHGLREKIVLCDGAILDGRNRERACRQAKVEPQFRNWSGKDPVAYVVSLNLKRRHLNESQRAMVAARLATMRQGTRTDLKPSANLPVVSQDQAAKTLNVSSRGLRQAAVVQHVFFLHEAEQPTGLWVGELGAMMPSIRRWDGCTNVTRERKYVPLALFGIGCLTKIANWDGKQLSLLPRPETPAPLAPPQLGLF